MSENIDRFFLFYHSFFLMTLVKEFVPKRKNHTKCQKRSKSIDSE